VKHFRATSGLGLPYICHVGDESGETPFYNYQYSVPELAVMSAWCETIDTPVIFDIGANNGFIATHLAQLLRKKNPRIYAFEPVPSTFAHLKLSIDRLGLSDVVFPTCRGVSDSSGEVKLFYNPRQSLFAQIRDDNLNPRAARQSVLVQTTTVDETIDSLQLTPNLLKVDVEGFEPRVFAGAARLLKSSTPPAICFEWNPFTLSEVKSRPSELNHSLPDYRLYYIDDFDGQRRPLGEEISNVTEISWVCNVFAVPGSAACEWEKIRFKAHSLIPIPAS
jgi:FkbM family methyltransferase